MAVVGELHAVDAGLAALCVPRTITRSRMAATFFMPTTVACTNSSPKMGSGSTSQLSNSADCWSLVSNIRRLTPAGVCPGSSANRDGCGPPLLAPREFVGHLAIGVEKLNYRIAFGIDPQHQPITALVVLYA